VLKRLKSKVIIIAILGAFIAEAATAEPFDNIRLPRTTDEFIAGITTPYLKQFHAKLQTMKPPPDLKAFHPYDRGVDFETIIRNHIDDSFFAWMQDIGRTMECMDWHLLNCMCVKLNCGMFGCSVSFEPVKEYYAAVQKNESEGNLQASPWTTGYYPELLVNKVEIPLKRAIDTTIQVEGLPVAAWLDEQGTRIKLLWEKLYLQAQGLDASGIDPLAFKFDREEFDKAAALPDWQYNRWTTAADGFRRSTYHAMADPLRELNKWMTFSMPGIGSFMCHHIKPVDPYKAMWNSDSLLSGYFPSHIPDIALKVGRMDWAVAMRKFIIDPTICSRFEKESGIVPLDMFEGLLPKGVLQPNPCVRFYESWLPPSEVIQGTSKVHSGIGSFVRGLKMAQQFRPDYFYKVNTGITYVDNKTGQIVRPDPGDKVQWRGQGFPEECMRIETPFNAFRKMGEGLLEEGISEAQLLKQGDGTKEEDWVERGSTLGIHWRKFQCCGGGNIIGMIGPQCPSSLQTE